MPDIITSTPENLQPDVHTHENIDPAEQNKNHVTVESESEQGSLRPDMPETMPADNSHGSETKEMLKQYKAGEKSINELMAKCDWLREVGEVAAKKYINIVIVNENKSDKGPTGGEVLAKKQADRAALKKAQEVTKAPKIPQPKKVDVPVNKIPNATKISTRKPQTVIIDLTKRLIEPIENTKQVPHIKLAESVRDTDVIVQTTPQRLTGSSKTLNATGLDNEINSYQQSYVPEISTMKNLVEEVIRLPKTIVEEDIRSGMLHPLSNIETEKYPTTNADSEINVLTANYIAPEAIIEETEEPILMNEVGNTSEDVLLTEVMTCLAGEADDPVTDMQISPGVFENNNYDLIGTDLDTLADLTQSIDETPILDLDSNILTGPFEESESPRVYEPAKTDEIENLACERTNDLYNVGIDVKSEIINFLPITVDIVEPANQQIIDSFSELIIDKLDNIKKSHRPQEALEPEESDQATINDQLEMICSEFLMALGLANNVEDIKQLLKSILPLTEENPEALPSWSQRIFSDSEGDHERLTSGLQGANPVANIIHGFIGRLALGFKSAA